MKSWQHFIESRLNPSTGTELSILWNNFLVLVAIFNVTALIIICSKTKKKSSQSLNGFWAKVAHHQYLLSLAYVIACAVRGIWPRMDEDRHCFYDTWISAVFIGRSLATLAELSYCAQLCLATVLISGRNFLANVLLLANVVAQTCCWYAVITQDQRGHIIEESIWLLTGAALTVFAWKYSLYAASGDNVTFVRVLGAAGVLYVLFMSIVDVPMYYHRYVRDTERNKVYLSFSTGLSQTLRCMHVTQQDSYWRDEMPWMTLYFTVAVWSSLWLAAAQLQPVLTQGRRQDKNE